MHGVDCNPKLVIIGTVEMRSPLHNPPFTTQQPQRKGQRQIRNADPGRPASPQAASVNPFQSGKNPSGEALRDPTQRSQFHATEASTTLIMIVGTMGECLLRRRFTESVQDAGHFPNSAELLTGYACSRRKDGEHVKGEAKPFNALEHGLFRSGWPGG